MKKTENTKELLLRTAGELFAEHGLDSVSTRMIADRAGVKLSAIHYHYGSKDNLYLSACLEAHDLKRPTTFAMVIAENPSLLDSPEGQAEIVRTVVFRTYHDHFKDDRPEWQSKILLREISHPTAAMETLSEKIFKPDVESSMNFYLHVRPGATEQQAAAWSDLLYGKLLLYMVAKETIEMARGKGCLDTEFYTTAAGILARAMILEAGLPLPSDLK